MGVVQPCNLSTVSYTHLDVYKRQSLKNSGEDHPPYPHAPQRQHPRAAHTINKYFVYVYSASAR